MQHRDRQLFWAIGLLALGGLLIFGIGNIFLALLFFTVIMLPGLGILALYYRGGNHAAPLAIPGLVIAGTGAILMFQALTGYWASWAFAWTLYGVFLGGGLMMMGEKIEDPSLVTIGRWFVAASGMAFLGLGGLFILLTTPFLIILLKFGLILGGAYLLIRYLRNHNNIPKAKRSAPEVEENIERIKVKTA